MRTERFPHDPVASEVISSLSQSLSLPLPIAEWLWRRGVQSAEDWRALNDEGPLSSPYALPDMDRAVAEILAALDAGRRIRIHGDYDADGVTATAVMVRGIQEIAPSAAVDFHIPNRFDEGYGLGEEAVERAADEGIDLLITVDCGSSSPAAAALAESRGIGLVITDHHGLPSSLPQARALVNPERMARPNRLSGAGVAWQVVRALGERVGKAMPEALMAIAAVGTVADVVPLRDDNRKLVRQGLEVLRAGKVPGISALAERAGRSARYLTASDIAFYIGPRLNAVGRMADAAPAVELLSNPAPAILAHLVDALEAANAERRRVESELLQAAWDQLHEYQAVDGALPAFMVLGGEGWHHGVVGIVASRLKEILRRPVAVIGWEGDTGKGSARSVEGLHLLAHLRMHAEQFTKLGGHRGAAGFSLPRQSVLGLARRLSDKLPAAVLALRYRGEPVDGLLSAEAIDAAVLRWLERLEPTGHGFEPPRWMVRGTVREASPMGQAGRHLRFRFERVPWTGLAFSAGDKAGRVKSGEPLWTVGRLAWDVWRSTREARWHADGLLTEPTTAPWQDRVRLEPPPDPLSGTTVYIVDSQRDLASLKRLGVTVYDWTDPIAERAVVEERVRRGWCSTAAFSQWRPWPAWDSVADQVIWRGPPIHREGLAWAANLLADGGQIWIDSGWLTETRRDRLLAKWRRLVPDRGHLGVLWRALQAGQSPLLAGRGVFRELGLDFRINDSGQRARLTDAPAYRQAWRARGAAEEERRLDSAEWIVGRTRRHHAME